MSIATFGIFYFISKILVFSLSCAMFVFGVLVLVNKIKQTRILGASFVILGVQSMLNGFINAAQPFFGAAFYTKASVFNNFFGMAANIAIMFCICFYIHRNYGKKLIYIPIFAIMIVNRIASTVVSVLLNSSVKGALAAYWINLVNTVNSFISGTAIAAVIFLAFYQNREKEKIIPHTWKIRIILYAFFVLQMIYTICAYILLVKVAKNQSYDPGVIIGFLFSGGNAYNIISLLDILGVSVNLIFPIYVFIRLKKVQSQKTEEPAEIETAP